MSYKIIIIVLLLFKLFLNAQVISLDIDAATPRMKFENGKDVIDFMYQKYRQGPCKIYTFSQKNTHYRNDSIIGHSEWHEYIEFPDKFRIDFGDKTEGNYVIFRNDSSYSYRKNELKKTKYDSNILLLLLGGMYYREPVDVDARLKKVGYKTQVLSNQKWDKQAAFNKFNIGSTL